MGILGDSADRNAGTGAVSASVPLANQPLVRPTPEEEGRSELRRRRDALAEQVTELHWDLGGLAYEMAIRDHFRLDVLVRRAAVLQERDAELAEIERLLRLEESASAGSCPQLRRAAQSRGPVLLAVRRDPDGALSSRGGVGSRDSKRRRGLYGGDGRAACPPFWPRV